MAAIKRSRVATRVRAKLRISQEAMGELLCVSSASVINYELERTEPTGLVWDLYAALDVYLEHRGDPADILSMMDESRGKLLLRIFQSAYGRGGKRKRLSPRRRAGAGR